MRASFAIQAAEFDWPSSSSIYTNPYKASSTKPKRYHAIRSCTEHTHRAPIGSRLNRAPLVFLKPRGVAPPLHRVACIARTTSSGAGPGTAWASPCLPTPAPSLRCASWRGLEALSQWFSGWGHSSQTIPAAGVMSGDLDLEVGWVV